MKISTTKLSFVQVTFVWTLLPLIATALVGSIAYAAGDTSSAANDAAKRELSTAEASKEVDPEKYIYALLGMFHASVQNANARTSETEPQEGDKYYLDALTCLEKHPAILNKSDQYSNALRTLWSGTRMLSSKTFSTLFDRLCKCNDQVDKKYQHEADRSLGDALRDRRSELKGTEKKQLLQRAITLRKAKLGPTSPGLCSLYQQMAECCAQMKDSNEAEKYRVAVIGLGDTPSGLAYKWIDLAYFYGRIHKSQQEDAAWRKAMDIINKNTLEVDARSWIGLMDQMQGEGKQANVDVITDFVLTKPTDLNTLLDLDKYLRNRVDAYIKTANFQKAAELVRKRIAKPVSDPSRGMDPLEWQVRLSEILLAQGNEKDSQVVFSRVLASMALLGRPTDEIRSQRARLLEKFGMPGDAQKMQANLPNTRGPVIISAPMMAKEVIQFGHNNTILTFDSTVKRDAQGRLPMPEIPYPGRPDGPIIIICEGVISHTSNNVTVGGKIACKQSDFEQHRVTTVPLPAGIKINDAIEPPASAVRTLPSNSSAEGDFIATEFPSNVVSFMKNRTRPLRVFLQDDGTKSELGFSNHGSNNESYQQLQVWYNGTKPIKIHAYSGFLYAPHAVVHIEFNGSFSGCLVARQILLEGNNNINLDRSIIGRNMGQ
jgi:hypothetical protein